MDARPEFLVGELLNPLVFAGIVLVIGFFLTRLAIRASPIVYFLCQLASSAGFTAMLTFAKVTPFVPTPAMDVSPTYITVSLFKLVWWLAVSPRIRWLILGNKPATAGRRQLRKLRMRLAVLPVVPRANAAPFQPQ